MKLSTEDAGLFFDLMRKLEFYVNQKHQIIPDVDSVEDCADLLPDERVQVRNALWENPELIDAYVAENPYGLPDEHLVIVKKRSNPIHNFRISIPPYSISSHSVRSVSPIFGFDCK